MHDDERQRDRLLLRAPRADVERRRVGIDEQRRAGELACARVAQRAGTGAAACRRPASHGGGERPHDVVDAA